MRIFVATLGTETNTFSFFPTGIEDFKDMLWCEGDIEAVPASPWSAPAQIWVERARQEDWEVAQSLFAFASPAGPTSPCGTAS